MEDNEEDYNEVLKKSGFGSKIKELLHSQESSVKSFSESGTKHLTSVKWNDMNYKTAVLACLVQAVYVLERERQRGISSDHSASKAKSWWESLNFTLDKKLEDSDHVIFGAVFDYSNTPDSQPHPRKVIAFRGTLLRWDSWRSDFILDLRAFFGTLATSNRFERANEEIRNAVITTGNIADVWVAGHSLGAAVALLSGKIMARSHYPPLESHLFNPPFLSIPIEKLWDSKTFKDGFRFFGSILKAGIGKISSCKCPQKDKKQQSCEELTSWTPYLYLHKSDWFCSEYIGYFEHRAKMAELGAKHIERRATKMSLMSTLIDMYLTGIGESSSSQDSSLEPIHVLPSAYLTINNHKSNFLSSHTLRQWWNPKCTAEFKLYQFDK